MAGAGPVLAVEASSLRPSVALLGPTGDAWGRWDAPPGSRGTAAVAVAAQELLAARGHTPAQLAGVAVGIGPGSYTGLRASIAFALGLAWPRRLPVAGIPSVAAAARAVLCARADVESVTVLLDARRGESYRADYRRGDPLCEVLAPCLVPSATVDGLVDAGSTVVLREAVPDANHVAHLAWPILEAGGQDPAQILPLYLKRSHAEIALEQRNQQG